MIIHSLAARKILILIFICMAPSLAATSDNARDKKTRKLNDQTAETETDGFVAIDKETVIQELLKLHTQKPTTAAHYSEQQTAQPTKSENICRPPRPPHAVEDTTTQPSKPVTRSITQSLSQQQPAPQPNAVHAQAATSNQVATIAPTLSAPVCLTPMIMDAIQLKSIFVLLYFFAIQIDFGGNHNGDFLYVGREPELCIYRAIDTLDLIIKTNRAHIDIKIMMRFAYEAVQIFNLISYLPHESQLRSEFRGNFYTATQPSKTLRNPANYISLDEEFLTNRLVVEYDPVSMSFATSANYSLLDLHTLINLCKKFMYKTLPLFEFYPYSPYNPECSASLSQRYQAFKAGRGGMQKIKDIVKARATVPKDNPWYFKSADGLTEFDDAETPHDLEGYHGARWMKAYIKIAEMATSMNDNFRYPHADKPGLQTMLTRLATHLYNNKQVEQAVELEQLHTHVDSVVFFVETLIKEQFKVRQP